MAPCTHLPDSWAKAGARGDQRTVSVSWVSFVRPAERNPELQAGVPPTPPRLPWPPSLHERNYIRSQRLPVRVQRGLRRRGRERSEDLAKLATLGRGDGGSDMKAQAS